jgi:hypothetical protein
MPARHALSQLSYGPVAAQSSRELEILCPVNAVSLIVLRSRNAKKDLSPGAQIIEGDEVAALVVGTVGCERIDFSGGIDPSPNTLARSSARVAANEDGIANPRRPLALDAQEILAEKEDHVEPASLGDWAVDLDPELRRLMSDRCLRNRALLIRRQHRQRMLVVGSDD